MGMGDNIEAANYVYIFCINKTDMGTIYRNKDGKVFDSLTIIAADGRYAIDITDMNNVKAYPLKELATLAKSRFDFIQRYHPNYNCDEVGWLSDLDCLIDNECDDEKLERLTYVYGSDPEEWERKHDELMQELFDEAKESYLNIF